MDIKATKKVLRGVCLMVFSCLAAQNVYAKVEVECHFEKDLCGLEKLSPDKPYSISISNVEKRKGSSSVKFELRGNEVRVSKKGKKSFRSELATERYVKAKSTQWYGFSLLIPKNFPIEDNRLVLAQWWAPPDKGEVSKSPSLAFRFVNGKFYVSLRIGAEKIIKSGSGHEKILWQDSAFDLGTWNDFVIHVKWSYLENGFVNIWKGGKQIVNYNGPVGYNDDVGPAFQFGIYRDKSEKTYIVFFDEYKEGDSFKAVAVEN